MPRQEPRWTSEFAERVNKAARAYGLKSPDELAMETLELDAVIAAAKPRNLAVAVLALENAIDTLLDLDVARLEVTQQEMADRLADLRAPIVDGVDRLERTTARASERLNLQPDILAAHHAARSELRDRQYSRPPWEEPSSRRYRAFGIRRLLPAEVRACVMIRPEQRAANTFYVPSLVIEGEPGHRPMTGWRMGAAMSQAHQTCDLINVEVFSRTADEAASIVTASVAAGAWYTDRRFGSEAAQDIMREIQQREADGAAPATGSSARADKTWDLPSFPGIGPLARWSAAEIAAVEAEGAPRIPAAGIPPPIHSAKLFTPPAQARGAARSSAALPKPPTSQPRARRAGPDQGPGR